MIVIELLYDFSELTTIFTNKDDVDGVVQCLYIILCINCCVHAYYGIMISLYYSLHFLIYFSSVYVM